MRRVVGLFLVASTGLASIALAATPPVFVLTWGSPGYGDGQFQGPGGVATDAAGDVYVTDYSNNRIQKFSSSGTYVTQWGSAGSGNGQFNGPIAVATDAAGDVYVADNGNYRIQKFTSTGTYLTQWGSTGSGNGQFSYPSGVATDAVGDVYVADYYNYRIQKFTGTGSYLTQWGSAGSGNGQFDGPSGVGTDAVGDVYITDVSGRIQKFTSTGTYLTQWGSTGSADSQFNNPLGVASDAAGDVYVTDFHNHRVQKFTSTGTYLTQWGSYGGGEGELIQPYGVATDATGDVYVADNGNHRIQKFNKDADGDGFGATYDCDDAHASVYPGAIQQCDGVNNDCRDPSWPAVPTDERDTDGDGVVDCADNCLRTPNAGQTNADGDTCGDACDPVPVSLRFTPVTLNKSAQGLYVKCHISFAPNHTAAHIDPSQTISLSVAGGPPIPDVGRVIVGNAIDVSFSRQDVSNDAPMGESVEFRVTGLLTYGCEFEGVDHVRVIQEGKLHTDEGDPSSILDDAPRGDVATLGQSGSGDLGPATCLPDYHSNYDFTLNTDDENPPSKKAYFYLFKFCNGTPTCSYGQTSSGAERTVGSGGCP